MITNKFNKVIIKNITQQPHNVHLAVHPFYFGDEMIRMFDCKGHYDTIFDKPDLIDWQKRMLDSLWDNIPGIHCIFFTNGEITLQHSGVFEDNEIIEAASEIIKPFLEETLKLQNMLEGAK